MVRRRCHVTPSLITVFFSLSYASATSYAPNANTVDCQLASVYQHVNAYAQFNISAASVANPIKAEVLNTSETDHWKARNALSVSSKAFCGDTNPLLKSLIFLDVSSTLHFPSNANEAGLSGCTFVFSLPASDLEKTDDGSCKSVFDDACLKNVNSDAVESTSKVIFEGAITMNDTVMCDSSNPVESQPKVPSSILRHNVPITNIENYIIYDQWAQEITPILLTLFSKVTAPFDNSDNQTDMYAGAQLVCSSSSVIRAGSRTALKAEANDADPVFGVTDMWRIVVSGMLVNACLFWLL